MLLSLSTCWNSHRCLEGHELVLQAKQVGFDHIEISHVTKPSLMPGLMKSINAGAIQISSLHAPCPPTEELALDAPDRYELTHDDPANREQALKLAQQSIELAAQVRCPIVILHLGTVAMEPITPRLEAMASAGQAYSRAYIEQKLRLVTERAKQATPYLDRARSAVDQLLPLAQAAGVKLAVENRHQFEALPTAEELATLLKAYDTPHFGLWHDFGHTQRLANLAFLAHDTYLREFGPRVLGAHVHDVAWPVTDHRTPFSTNGVDFDQLLPLLPKGIPLVWELHQSQRRLHVTEARLEWLRRYAAM